MDGAVCKPYKSDLMQWDLDDPGTVKSYSYPRQSVLQNVCGVSCASEVQTI